MWKSITNPINGKKIIVDSMEGRTLIKSYLENLKGGSDTDQEETADVKLFRETQVDQFCGKHAINNLLQQEKTIHDPAKGLWSNGDDIHNETNKLNLYKLALDLGSQGSSALLDLSERNELDENACCICGIQLNQEMDKNGINQAIESFAKFKYKELNSDISGDDLIDWIGERRVSGGILKWVKNNGGIDGIDSNTSDEHVKNLDKFKLHPSNLCPLYLDDDCKNKPRCKRGDESPCSSIDKAPIESAPDLPQDKIGNIFFDKSRGNYLAEVLVNALESKMGFKTELIKFTTLGQELKKLEKNRDPILKDLYTKIKKCVANRDFVGIIMGDGSHYTALRKFNNGSLWIDSMDNPIVRHDDFLEVFKKKNYGITRSRGQEITYISVFKQEGSLDINLDLDIPDTEGHTISNLDSIQNEAKLSESQSDSGTSSTSSTPKPQGLTHSLESPDSTETTVSTPISEVSTSSSENQTPLQPATVSTPEPVEKAPKYICNNNGDEDCKMDKSRVSLKSFPDKDKEKDKYLNLANLFVKILIDIRKKDEKLKALVLTYKMDDGNSNQTLRIDFYNGEDEKKHPYDILRKNSGEGNSYTLLYKKFYQILEKLNDSKLNQYINCCDGIKSNKKHIREISDHFMAKAKQEKIVTETKI